jgi:tetratricopeptide (TPR) repeat protein
MTVVAIPRPAHAAAASCVSPGAAERLSSCPGGTRRKATGRQKPAFRAAPPPRAKPNASVSPPPPRDLPPDPRKAPVLEKRVREFLLQELQNLGRLFARTPRRAPDRPVLLRRLADGYVELEQLAASNQIKLEIRVQDYLKKKQSAEADKARRAAAKEQKIAIQARRIAIERLTEFKRDYPNASKLDQVLYQLAFEHEQAGNADAARKAYLELIQKAPKSDYLPNAYLAFGELFFQEAQGDPTKWELAIQAYREVIRYPAPANKVHGYARYKLGYVFWNRGEHAEAMSELKKVVDLADKFPTSPNAKGLAGAARRDLVPLYAAAGAPEQAFRFFAPVSGDKSGETAKTIALMGELGVAYLDTGRYREALVLYRDLLGRDPGERSCGYQSRVVEATVGLRSADKEAILRELERQLAVRSDFERENHAAKAKLACGNRTAELLSETAMAWHLEAVGSGGVRGTGDRRTMALSEKLYKLVTVSFKQSDFARFEFPRLVRQDWPSLYRLRYARADLLYEQQRWDECGPAFAEVAAEDPAAAETPEALYASALCFQKSFQRAHAGGTERRGRGLGPSSEARGASAVRWEQLKPHELSAAQQQMIEAFDRFVCIVEPPSQAGEARDRYVEVKYARARTYFEAQNWEEAAVGFRDITLNHSDHESAPFASQLWLEALNVMFRFAEPKRHACLDDLSSATAQVAAKFCGKTRAAAVETICQQLTQVECDIGRKQAEQLVLAADANPAANIELYSRAANAYLALWRKHGAEPIAAGKEPECRGMDEVVYNMAKAYQAARLLAKAMEARTILVVEKWGLNRSPLAKRALYELGQNHQAIAGYYQAADFFERYAGAMDYKGEDVDRALSDAVVLHLGLGQELAAFEAAKAFEQKLGARYPERATEIAFALATHYSERENWEAARGALSRSMRLIDSKAPFDVRVQAHALHGRALSALKRDSDAAREYERTRELWRDPAAAVRAIEQTEKDPAARERRIGRAVTAVGEALFHAAEQKRTKVDAVRFPVYRGPGTKAAVLSHIRGEVATWVKTKRPLIEQASADYRQILDLGPAPPPSWVIAAGARVGQMWGQFVREFRAAPVPDYIKNDRELLGAYWKALDEASEPQKQMAKAAYETCTRYSVKFQFFDEHSKSCEAWLAENYKAQYHLVDEFRGAPTRANSALKEQSPALDVQGRPRLTRR